MTKWIPCPTACFHLLISSRCPGATIFAWQFAKHYWGNIRHLFATLQVKKDFGSFSFFWGSKGREFQTELSVLCPFSMAIFTFSAHVVKPYGTYKPSKTLSSSFPPSFPSMFRHSRQALLQNIPKVVENVSDQEIPTDLEGDFEEAAAVCSPDISNWFPQLDGFASCQLRVLRFHAI